jgi:hypothetical protein
MVQTATAADELCDGRNNSERIRQSDFRPERVDPALGFIGGQLGGILLRLVGLLGRNSIRAYLAEFGIVAPVGRRGVHMPSWFLVSRDTLEHA